LVADPLFAEPLFACPALLPRVCPADPEEHADSITPPTAAAHAYNRCRRLISVQ
jgi:hypothetical protein